MKKVKTLDGKTRNLPDAIANALIKNKRAIEIKRGRPAKDETEKVVAKEDKTVKQTKENKQIKKRSTK